MAESVTNFNIGQNCAVELRNRGVLFIYSAAN